MDQFLKPNTPAIDDTESDAIVVMTRDPELSQPPSPTVARDAVLVDATKAPEKHHPKALRLAQPLHKF